MNLPEEHKYCILRKSILYHYTILTKWDGMTNFLLEIYTLCFFIKTACFACLFWIDRKLDKARSWLHRGIRLQSKYGDGWAYLYKFEKQHRSKVLGIPRKSILFNIAEQMEIGVGAG